jgi:hypothetical protein
MQIELAAFLIEHQHDRRGGMVQDVRGFHVQQNLQRAATKFFKAATTPLKKRLLLQRILQGLS